MKMYGIIKEGYFCDDATKREIEHNPYLFEDKEEARNYCEQLCAEECKDLNADRKQEDFRWDEDGSEKYDYVTRFWDGDDYSLVTGYIIAEFECC